MAERARVALRSKEQEAGRTSSGTIATRVAGNGFQ
jgi:hypothetical protein